MQNNQLQAQVQDQGQEQAPRFSFDSVKQFASRPGAPTAIAAGTLGVLALVTGNPVAFPLINGAIYGGAFDLYKNRESVKTFARTSSEKGLDYVKSLRKPKEQADERGRKEVKETPKQKEERKRDASPKREGDKERKEAKKAAPKARTRRTRK